MSVLKNLLLVSVVGVTGVCVAVFIKDNFFNKEPKDDEESNTTTAIDSETFQKFSEKEHLPAGEPVAVYEQYVKPDKDLKERWERFSATNDKITYNEKDGNDNEEYEPMFMEFDSGPEDVEPKGVTDINLDELRRHAQNNEYLKNGEWVRAEVEEHIEEITIIDDDNIETEDVNDD